MRSTARRHCLGLLATVLIAVLHAGPAPAMDGNSDHDTASRTALMGNWRLARSPNPRGGVDAVSIMHAADLAKSDIDFAGLIIRCHEGGQEIVVVLTRPLPLRTRPSVVIGRSRDELSFDATVGAPGTAVVLPRGATAQVVASWQTMPETNIRIEDGPTSIRGVVVLSGLRAAFRTLLESCPTP